MIFLFFCRKRKLKIRPVLVWNCLGDMEALGETLLGPRSDLYGDIGNEYYIELTLDVVTEIKVSSRSLTKSVLNLR